MEALSCFANAFGDSSDEEEECSSKQPAQSAANNNSSSTTVYLPHVPNSEWFLKERQRHTALTEDFILIKTCWDRMYLKRQYRVILNEMSHVKDCLIADEKAPMFLKREMYQTWVRCLTRLVVARVSNERVGGESLSVQEAISMLNDLTQQRLLVSKQWLKQNSVKMRAAFQLFLWEQTAKILTHSDRVVDWKKGIHLIQKCIHCFESLPMCFSEYQVTSKKELDKDQSGAISYLDSLYMVHVRSYTLWNTLAELYGRLEMHKAQKLAARQATILLEPSTYYSNIKFELPERSELQVEFDELQSNNFGQTFIDIYLLTCDSVHQIMHAQRSLMKQQLQ